MEFIKSGIMTFAIRWIKLEIIVLGEVSQTQTNTSLHVSFQIQNLEFHITNITYKLVAIDMYMKGKSSYERGGRDIKGAETRASNCVSVCMYVCI